MDERIIEELAEAAHEGWMASRRKQGITSRQSEWGEEDGGGNRAAL